MSTPNPFVPVYVTHGRGGLGDTGHVHSVALGRTLCNVEKRVPWLDALPVDLDDGEPGPKTLDEWLGYAGGRFICGTCLRLYQRAARPTVSRAV